jgi:predicted patatin/cPLA2 family phospholipase
MDLKYLVNSVLADLLKVDFERLHLSDVEVRIVASRARSFVAECLDRPSTVTDWKLALCASSCVPIAAGGPIRFRDDYWYDGAIGEPLSVVRAIDEGATHVLALLSRANSEGLPVVPVSSRIADRFLDRRFPGIERALKRWSHTYASQLTLCDGYRRTGHLNVAIAAIRPLRACGVQAMTTSASRLHCASQSGMDAVHRYFEAT